MKELFKKYLDNKCSPEEVKLLLKEFEASQNEEVLKSLIHHQLGEEQEMNLVNGNELDNVLSETYSNIKRKIAAGKKSESVPVVSIFKHTWFRVAAAAVIILIATGAYLLLNKTGTDQPITGTDQPITNIEPPLINDIAPGGNKAILTLADNTQIILDSVANGDLTNQGNVKVIKLDGQLAYTSSGNSTEVLYNTITTPRGGQYQLVLADGSKVWLNAESSLRFPASFVGKERRVELTGEGYFEVAKNASMPFRVTVAGKGEVEVLGTHFNINSYSDEVSINTTLLEGSVKVKALTVNNPQILKPGDQAQLNTNGQISITKNVDLDQVIAWKNDQFNFNNAGIEIIMRQISRWYDADILYSGKISTETFSGIVSRKKKLSEVLKIMEQGGIKFKVEGNNITVME